MSPFDPWGRGSGRAGAGGVIAPSDQAEPAAVSVTEGSENIRAASAATTAAAAAAAAPAAAPAAPAPAPGALRGSLVTAPDPTTFQSPPC